MTREIDESTISMRSFDVDHLRGPQEAHEGDCVLKYFHNVAAGKWMLAVTTQTADIKFTLEPALQQATRIPSPMLPF
jgi:hypothetical protein